MNKCLLSVLICFTLHPLFAGAPCDVRCTQDLIRQQIQANQGLANPIGPNYKSTCKEAGGNCLIFETKALVNGNMSLFFNPLNINNPTSDGLNGGDQVCQQEGDLRFGAGKQWVAWLSTGAESAATRAYNANRLYFNLNGGVVAAPGKLLSTTPVLDNPIGFSQVWTGTLNTGLPSPDDCNEWTSTSNADSGTIGDAKSVLSIWTKNNPPPDVGCNGTLRLYCFEK